MIYLDSSVALARIFKEARRPSTRFWEERLTSSALLTCEVWNRVNASGLARSVEADVERVLERVEIVALSSPALERCLRPFPTAVRTLDGLHLATADYIRRRGAKIEVASYDARLLSAAAAMGFATAQP